MKLPFRPRQYARVLLGLAALTLTQCNKAPVDAPTGSATTTPGAPVAGAAPGNSIAIVGEGASPAFRAVASRLELGARSFEYSEVGGATALAGFLDEILKSVPATQRNDLPANFTFAKLFEILGLDAITATGSSSRARTDGTFHSRTFAYMPQGRKGLLTLSGGPAAKLLLLELAPKDTDLAMEFPISLKNFGREVMPAILDLIPAGQRAQAEQEMARPLPPLGINGKQMIEKLDAHLGIFIRLDPTQKFQPSPDAPVLPGADGVIVIDRLGWLVEALKPQFMPKLSQPGSPFAVNDEAGVLTLRFTKPAGPPPMDFQPVLRFDSKADRIIIATRPALFDSVVAGKQKITQGADFTQAWRDLPGDGNSCVYASPRLLQTIRDLIVKGAQASGTSPADAAMIGKISDWVKPLLSRGHALVLANQPDGVLILSNTSIPAGGSSMTAVSTIAVLAGFALPVVSSAQQKARQADDISKLKQLCLGLKMYAGDNDGRYPAALSGLMPIYVGTDKILEFTDHRTKQRTPWLYRNSLAASSPANEVLVAAPMATSDGKRVVGFNDGSVRVIPEAEFQALWPRK